MAWEKWDFLKTPKCCVCLMTMFAGPDAPEPPLFPPHPPPPPRPSQPPPPLMTIMSSITQPGNHTGQISPMLFTAFKRFLFRMASSFELSSDQPALYYQRARKLTGNKKDSIVHRFEICVKICKCVPKRYIFSLQPTRIRIYLVNQLRDIDPCPRKFPSSHHQNQDQENRNRCQVSA